MAKKVKKAVEVKEVKQEERIPFYKKYLFELVIFGFSFLLYCNSIPNNYNLDDNLVTLNHPLTSRGISAIPDIFVSPYYKDAMGYAYEYRPVVLTSFAVEHSLFGDNPHVSHFINVLLYALCCLLLFVVLRKLFGKYTVLLALGISLLFAAHPAHTEVVCSIKNRDEILGLIFSLLGLWFAIQAAGKSGWYLIAVAASFTLALMSKMTFIPFAVLIPLAIIFFTGADLKMVMAITFALAFPAFFLIDVGEFYHKVLIELGIFAASLTAYPIVRGIKFRPKISFPKNFISESSSPNTPFSNLKLNFSDALPGRGDFAVIQGCLSAISFGVIVAGLFWHIKGLMVAGAIGVAATEFFTPAGKKFLPRLVSLITLLTLYILFAFREGAIEHNMISLNHIIVMLLVCNVLFISPKYLVPAAIGIVILAGSYMATYPSAFFAGGYFTIIFQLIWIVPYLWKRGKLILYAYTLLAAAIFIMTVYSLISTGAIAGFDFRITALLMVIGSVRMNIYGRYIEQLMKLGIILFLVWALPASGHIQFSRIPGDINEIGKGVNTNIYTGKTDRPVLYLENPVNINDLLSTRLGTSMYILSRYLYKVIIPYPMSYYYGYKYIVPKKITNPVPLASLAVYLALLGLALFFIRKKPVISFGIFLYLASVIIYSDYIQYVPGLFAERFMLVPSLGWCIILTVLLFTVFKRDLKNYEVSLPGLPTGLKYSFIAVLLFYSSLTFARNFDWKDDLTLFRHDISYVDNSAQAHNLLGIHLLKYAEKEPENAIPLTQEALLHLKKSTEIYPSFFNTQFDLGRVYMKLNMPDSALLAFKRAAKLKDNFSQVQLNIGYLLMAKGDLEGAIPYFQKAITINHYDYMGYGNLAYAYFKLHQPYQSITVNEQAIEVVHNVPDPFINLARTFISLNAPDSALVYLEKAEILFPGNTDITTLTEEAKEKIGHTSSKR